MGGGSKAEVALGIQGASAILYLPQCSKRGEKPMRKVREAWKKVGMRRKKGGYTNLLMFGVVCRKDAN